MIRLSLLRVNLQEHQCMDPMMYLIRNKNKLVIILIVKPRTPSWILNKMRLRHKEIGVVLLQGRMPRSSLIEWFVKRLSMEMKVPMGMTPITRTQLNRYCINLVLKSTGWRRISKESLIKRDMWISNRNVLET